MAQFVNASGIATHLKETYDKLGDRKWFDRTINKGMTRLATKYAVGSGCPYPKHITDPGLFTPVEVDPLVKMNEKFREVYMKTKHVTLTSVVKTCVIVSDGCNLVFFVDGVRSEPISIVPQVFLDLKFLAHIPFTLYLILDPFSHGRHTHFPLKEMQDFKSSLDDVGNVLTPRFKWTQYFGKNLLPVQQQIFNLTTEFYTKVMEKQSVNRTELVEFCRKIQPFIKDNIRNAAVAQVNELHHKVMQFSESITHEQWENVRVVIMGSHMARKGFLVSQYFAKLFGIREDDDKKLIFAEGNYEEGFALDLLATNATDTEASEAFFGDPEFMHADILASPTEEYLEELFHEATNIYVAIAQTLIIPSDKVGNHKRLRSAAKKASSTGVDLICFPDNIMNAAKRDPKLAEPINGPTVTYLIELAQTYQLWICAGILEVHNSTIVNSVILIDKQGKILLHHHEGDAPKVVSSRFGEICAVTYKDTRKSLEAIKKLNPSLLIVPFGVVESESKWPLNQNYSISTIVQSLATSLKCCVVGTNGISESLFLQWSENIEYGASLAADELGHVIKKTTPCKEHVKFVQLKLNSQKRPRNENWNKLKQSWRELITKPEVE